MPRGRRPGEPQPAPDRSALEKGGVEPELARLAEAIGTVRVQRGWTRQQLADASGTNNRIVLGIESGIRDPNFTTVVKLCRALRIQKLDVS